MHSPGSILITGSSSGIGAALARIYAAPGISLFLHGRNRERLERLSGECAERGAGVSLAAIDVTDGPALADWIEQCDSQAALDLLIANAGISAGTGSGGEDADQTRGIFATNLDGVLNTVLPAIEPMRRRGRGQIAIMASLAAFRGFPGAPAYCASKAAVRVWGEALRGSLRRDGIAVSVICPGFVRSPMTAVNSFPMPFLIDSDRAAAAIKRGLARNKARIAFPFPLAAAIWLLAALPPGLIEPLLDSLPEKR